MIIRRCPTLGNFFTVREIGEKYDLQVLRFFMLSAHYRSPLNFSAELMEASKNGLDRILTGVEKLKELEEKAAAGTMSAAELENQKKAMELVEKYEAAMEDDFNTADAVSAVFELVKLSNSTASAESTSAYVGWMKETIERLCGVLGIITEKKEEILDSEIEDMIGPEAGCQKGKGFCPGRPDPRKAPGYGDHPGGYQRGSKMETGVNSFSRFKEAFRAEGGGRFPVFAAGAGLYRRCGL